MLTSVAGLATILRSLRTVIRVYLKYKPTLLDRLNPTERAVLEQIAALIDEFFAEQPIPD